MRVYKPLQKSLANSNEEALQKTINEKGFIDEKTLQSYKPNTPLNKILQDLCEKQLIFYRIDRDPQDDVFYQLAGEFLSGNVKAKYGGQIRTPDLEGKQYIGIYEEVLPETENKTENAPETEIVSRAEEETDPPDLLRTSLAERIIEWLESHVTTITVSIGILFFLAAGIWLFVKTGKKPGRQSP